MAEEDFKPTEEERIIMEGLKEVLESYKDGGLLDLPYQFTIIGGKEGQYFLGWLHYTARADLPNAYMKNDVMAYAWLNISANNGFTRAEELRDRVEAELTPVERSFARNLATQWLIEKLQGKFKS